MVASITSCSENTPSTRQCERRFPGTGSAKLPAVRPPSGTAGRTSPFLRECFYQPVRPSGLSPDIEAGDERAAGLQNAPCFAKRFLLVGERVEAVHADDEIKGFAGHLQLPHIALYALNMRIAAQPLLGLRQHIYAVIQTGNARVFQPRPFAFREHSCSDRNIEKRARKIAWNIGQAPSRNLPVVRAAPEQPDV